jgi:hypothetical protein
MGDIEQKKYLQKRYKIEDIRKHPWFNLVKCEENFRGTIVGID